MLRAGVTNRIQEAHSRATDGTLCNLRGWPVVTLIVHSGAPKQEGNQPGSSAGQSSYSFQIRKAGAGGKETALTEIKFPEALCRTSIVETVDDKVGTYHMVDIFHALVRWGNVALKCMKRTGASGKKRWQYEHGCCK